MVVVVERRKGLLLQTDSFANEPHSHLSAIAVILSSSHPGALGSLTDTLR